jgi:bacterial/archaeal transporter family-2 protein
LKLPVNKGVSRGFVNVNLTLSARNNSTRHDKPMSTNAFLLVFAFVIGCLIPLQAAINNSLRVTVESGAVFAAFMSFLVGTIILGVMCFATGEKWSSVMKLSNISTWQLAGGLLGAVFVFGTTMLAPRIGVAVMLGLLIAGQMIASLVLDRAGFLGLLEREITAARAGGTLLVIVGVLLINFGDRWKLG